MQQMPGLNGTSQTAAYQMAVPVWYPNSTAASATPATMNPVAAAAIHQAQQVGAAMFPSSFPSSLFPQDQLHSIARRPSIKHDQSQ